MANIRQIKWNDLIVYSIILSEWIFEAYLCHTRKSMELCCLLHIHPRSPRSPTRVLRSLTFLLSIIIGKKKHIYLETPIDKSHHKVYVPLTAARERGVNSNFCLMWTLAPFNIKYSTTFNWPVRKTSTELWVRDPEHIITLPIDVGYKPNAQAPQSGVFFSDPLWSIRAPFSNRSCTISK